MDGCLVCKSTEERSCNIVICICQDDLGKSFIVDIYKKFLIYIRYLSYNNFTALFIN